mgnify:CR=1 FL=1
MHRIAWMFAVLAVSTGCNGNSTVARPSPNTAPTPVQGPTPPPPTDVNLNLTGTVADAATSARVAGATVRILDGVNIGRSTTTNASGEYRFENLETGHANLAVTAAGYSESRLDVFIDGKNALNFTLTRSGAAPN